MKYSVSARQSLQTRKKADEIYFDYKDFNAIYDMVAEMPDKEYVTRITAQDNPDWDDLAAAAEKCNLTIALQDMSFVNKIPYNIDFYWAYPITLYSELNRLDEYGVSQFLLGSPLTFDLEKIKEKYNQKIRVVANNCSENKYIPDENGINGFYIRPEDIPLYEDYIDTIEFDTDSRDKEDVLLDVYKKQSWPGDLNILISNLNYSIDNSKIGETFAKRRLSCAQRCKSNKNCSHCKLIFTSVRKVDEINQANKRARELYEEVMRQVGNKNII